MKHVWRIHLRSQNKNIKILVYNIIHKNVCLLLSSGLFINYKQFALNEARENMWWSFYFICVLFYLMQI